MRFNTKLLNTTIIGVMALQLIFMIVGAVTKNVQLTLILLSTLTATSILLSGFILFINSKLTYNNDINLEDSSNMFINDVLNFAGAGFLFFDSKNRITWVSTTLRDKAMNSLIGKKYDTLFKTDNSYSEISETSLNQFKKNGYELFFTFNGLRYSATVIEAYNIVAIKYIEDVEVIWEELSKVRPTIIFIRASVDKSRHKLTDVDTEYNIFLRSALTDWSKEHHASYNPASNIKETHQIMISESDFYKFNSRQPDNLFNYIKNVSSNKNFSVIISIGVGVGRTNYNSIHSLAMSALRIAEDRGGDQMVINRENAKTKYYGISDKFNLVSSRIATNLFVKNLISNLSKAKSVVIGGHSLSDFDSFSSAIVMYEIVKKLLKPNIPIRISISTYDKSIIEYMEENENIISRYKEIIEAPRKLTPLVNKSTMFISVDTSTKSQSDLSTLLSKNSYDNLVIIDHHRKNQDSFKTKYENTYIDPAASSAAEIITDIYRFAIGDLLNADLARLLLSAIILDTKQLKYATTSKTFETIGFLKRSGANVNISKNDLKMNKNDYVALSKIIQNSQIVNEFIIYSFDEDETRNKTSPIPSIAADSLLEIKNMKLSIVISKSFNNKYKMSLRSDGSYNVSLIAEAFGGGGGFTSSAAVFSISSKEKILSKIISIVEKMQEEVK